MTADADDGDAGHAAAACIGRPWALDPFYRSFTESRAAAVNSAITTTAVIRSASILGPAPHAWQSVVAGAIVRTVRNDEEGNRGTEESHS